METTQKKAGLFVHLLFVLFVVCAAATSSYRRCFNMSLLPAIPAVASQPESGAASAASSAAAPDVAMLPSADSKARAGGAACLPQNAISSESAKPPDQPDVVMAHAEPHEDHALRSATSGK